MSKFLFTPLPLSSGCSAEWHCVKIWLFAKDLKKLNWKVPRMYVILKKVVSKKNWNLEPQNWDPGPAPGLGSSRNLPLATVPYSEKLVWGVGGAGSSLGSDIPVFSPGTCLYHFTVLGLGPAHATDDCTISWMSEPSGFWAYPLIHHTTFSVRLHRLTLIYTRLPTMRLQDELNSVSAPEDFLPTFKPLTSLDTTLRCPVG